MSAPPQTVPPAPLAGRRAWVVEPCEPARLALGELLARYGVASELLASAHEASARIVAGMSPPALLISPEPVTWPSPVDAPAFIRLTREGDPRSRDPRVVELARPVRWRRLVAAVHQALGLASPAGVDPPSAGRVSLGLHVLVAEDNLINQEVTLGMLDELGCRAEVVENGALALELLGGDHRFDVVLMDCQMPVMDGFEAVRALRRLEEEQRRPRHPVVALTANASREDQEACRAAGMDLFLSKPFRGEQLAALLERAVRPGERAPGRPGERAPADTGPTAPLLPEAATVLDHAALQRIRALQRPGRPDLLRKVLGLFVTTSPAQLDAIRRAAAAGDTGTVAKQAHALKGSSGNLGLVALVERLAEIERTARRGALDEVAALLPSLESAHAEALAAIMTELSRHTLVEPTEVHHAR